MDFKNSLTKRYDEMKPFILTGDNKYDYEKYGILNKSLPKILFKGNSIFVTFLQLIDLRIVMMFKYCDKIKRFKFLSWYD